MRLFVGRLAIFICLISLIVLATYFLFSSTHKFLPSESYFSKEFDRFFSEYDFELVAIGNSKLLASIDVNTLEQKTGLKSVMAGYSSANISISKLLLESYLRKSTPKVVLLEVSWFTFNTSRTNFHSIAGDLFLKDYRLAVYLSKYKPQFYQHIRTAISEQFYGTIRTIEQTDFSSRIEDLDPNEKSYDFDINGFEYFFPDSLAGINNLLLKDFQYIVDACVNSGITLVLYTAPEDAKYTLTQRDRLEIKQIFTDASLEKNIYYLDYSLGGDLYSDSYELWLRDSHHLNEPTLFTVELAEQLNNINY